VAPRTGGAASNFGLVKEESLPFGRLSTLGKRREEDLTVFGKLHTASLPIVYKSHTAEGCQAACDKKASGGCHFKKTANVYAFGLS
jgi:hypothetical protein